MKECRELEESFWTCFTSQILKRIERCVTQWGEGSHVQGWQRTSYSEMHGESPCHCWRDYQSWLRQTVGFWLGSLVRKRAEPPQYRGDQRPCPLCTAVPLQTSVLQHLFDHRRTDYLLQGVCYQSLLDLLERLDLCVLCNFSKVYAHYCFCMCTVSCSHWTEIDELRTSYFDVNICDSN